MPTVTFGLWLLYGFATVVFAAVSVRGRWSSFCAAIGLVFGVLAARVEAASLEPTVVLAVLVAVLGLIWPRHWILGSVTAGVMAGVWSGLFQRQGLSWIASIPLAAGVLMLAAWLAARRPQFAPPVLRDEALLIVFVLGCLVVIAPEVQEGWRAAMTLAAGPGSAAVSIPPWTVALSLTAMALGGAYSLWSRR
jgi:hypothetical protein